MPADTPFPHDSLDTIGRSIKSGQVEEALAACGRLLRREPTSAAAWSMLAAVRLTGGLHGWAITALRVALALDPTGRDGLVNLASALRGCGLPRMAARWAARAVGIGPGLPDLTAAAAWSTLIFVLNELDDPDLPGIARAFARAAAPAAPVPPPRRPAGSRRLVIGLVSADLRRHACASFIAPLLDHLDRRRFAVVAYAEVPGPDAITATLRASCDGWCDTVGLGDDALAARIRADGVDLLLDLGGHTGNHRLTVFAHRPARVQAAWLGYNGTTGLEAIDWRLTDGWALPPDSDQWFSERIWRLPRAAHCFRPLADLALAPPADGRPVTFGSFNQFAKLSPATVAAWTTILDAVPGSRLLLKAVAGDPAGTARSFARAGVGPDRLTILPALRDPAGHLAAYAALDIALDPFPYNGTTTTCEALWMGVPVVALTGRRLLSRQGYAILAALGLAAELAAATVEGYVALAVGLARDRARLAALRAELRPRMAASQLRDEAGFTSALGDAFTAMIAQSA